MKKWLMTGLLALGLLGWAHADEALRQAIASPLRTPAFAARDGWRHPYETLTFFGLRPDSTVVEISPGGGWYTEILAPYLREKGQLILAADDPLSTKPETVKGLERLKAKLATQPALYDRVKLGVFAPPDKLDYAASASADLVLTFRNVHNWMSDGDAGVRAVFASAYRALKKGGVLGVVEHRLPAAAIQDATSSSGYVHQDYVVQLAQEVGFRLEASSEINANSKDTADHVGGVWALPPTYANKDVDRDKYQAIGESDRMTLKFVKP
ncbi:methyltransferase [Rhodoferax sp. GW822-FHT02A01]|uniref:class I SAM-dependent methyltransferase n=1 Tax=Rhodoferax sp. GW822-FHT02A01 TaxID=3141537 RepID=UPI00315D2461